MARLYGRWAVELPGEKDLIWEPDETTLAESLMIESELGGMAFDDWVAAIDERRPVACQVLVWFLRRKGGEQVDRLSVNFPIRRLELTKVEEDEPDPEASAGSSPATD